MRSSSFTALSGQPYKIQNTKYKIQNNKYKISDILPEGLQ
jgi:hypothetical protein